MWGDVRLLRQREDPVARSVRKLSLSANTSGQSRPSLIISKICLDIILSFCYYHIEHNRGGAAHEKVQETIMNISIRPADFRRKISDYVAETDEYTQGAGHRPAKLYRRKTL